MKERLLEYKIDRFHVNKLTLGARGLLYIITKLYYVNNLNLEARVYCILVQTQIIFCGTNCTRWITIYNL